jgi:hypothetical protein
LFNIWCAIHRLPKLPPPAWHDQDVGPVFKDQNMELSLIGFPGRYEENIRCLTPIWAEDLSDPIPVPEDWNAPMKPGRGPTDPEDVEEAGINEDGDAPNVDSAGNSKLCMVVADNVFRGG